MYQTRTERPQAGGLAGELNDVFTHWEDVRGTRLAPAWDDFDWLRIPVSIIPWCGLVDVRRDPVDFVYRFFGTARVQVQDRDLTGQSVRELRPVELGEKAFDEYAAVLEHRQPLMVETFGAEDISGKAREYRFLRLPFSDDGEHISQILAVSPFNALEIRALHNFLEPY